MNVYAGMLVLTILSGPLSLFDGPLPWPVPDFVSLLPTLEAIIPDVTISDPTHSEGYAAQVASLETNADNLTGPIADLRDQVEALADTLPDFAAGMDESTGLDPIGSGVMTYQEMADSLGEEIGTPFGYGKNVITVTTGIGNEFPTLAPIATMLSTILIMVAWMFLVVMIKFFLQTFDMAMTYSKAAIDLIKGWL